MSGMKHDSLCERPNGPNFAMCYCDLIARVAKRERGASLRDAVEAVKAAYMKDGVAVRSQTEWGVELSVAAIEELRGN